MKVVTGFAAAIIISSCLTMLGDSELPEVMPENTTFRYNENAGMAPAWTKIVVNGGEIEFEDKDFDSEDPKISAAEVSKNEMEEVYKVFRENKFDLIENEEPEDIVLDSGGENLSIRAGTVSNNVSYGDNSPLSSANLSRYSAAKKALMALVKSKEGAMRPKPAGEKEQ